MRTVIINNREYADIEFTREQLQAGAEAQYGEGFDLSYLDPGVTEEMFWEAVKAQLILDANAGRHPEYGFRLEHTELPGRKVPSRRGGLRTVRCSCGWESGPANAASRGAEFAAHLPKPEAQL